MNAMKRTVMATVVAGVFGSAWGNPTTPTVVSGAALLSNPSASVMQVVNTPGTIINWQGFSIANGETTRFVQLNAASAVLNRAVGGNPSAILGRLESNGRVFLINPNGIVFGGGSVVDVAGLIASTRDITDANFLAGNYLFNGFSNGVITVQNGAQILTSTYGPGGQVWLFAKNVTNEAGATITTPQGQTVLAAGTELQVATNSLGQMSFAVATDGTNTVDSLGTIAADRGAVGMFADFVNHRGTVNAGVGGSVDMNAAAELRIQGASTINAPDGNITLRGGSLLEVEFDSVINADGASGRISFESNNLLVYPSGNVHAVGGDVTFVQYQPSQYLPATVQFPWATPNGFSDSNPIAFRRSDGNYVVRFQRTMSSGDAAGLFEAVLDGRTGALLSAPVAIAAGSAQAAAYNAARAAPAVATNTYNTKIAEANAALRTALDLATTTEQDGFDRAANTAAGAIDGLAPTVEALIATRKSQVDALRADATDHPGSHPNLDFEVSNIVGFYRGQTYDAVRLAVYESRLASAGVRPGMESAVPTVDTFNSTLADLLAAKFASRDSADATASAAITAANVAYSAASQAATTQLPVATAAYNASLVAGIPVFYSNADTSLRGVPLATRLPTGNGGAVVALRQPDRVISGDGEDGPYTYTELGGRGAGFEVRSATGALIASDPNLNALPMPDGTYLAHQTGGYDVYKLDGTYVRSEARGYGILIPNRLGGFSELQVEGPAQQVNYTKVVPAYTSLNYVPGVAGAATGFATRPGAANDDGSNPTSPRTNPTVPVIRGGPGGGAIVDDSSDICNSALCTGIAGVHRRWDEAQQAIEAGRIPPKDVGNMTEREFIDSLIAADNLGEGGKIDDQSAAVAVMALARAAGRGSAVSIDGALSTGFAMQDNGELRQLVLGYGDLGNMSPAERFNVLERWLGELKATQTLGAMGQERTNATISIRDIVSNMTTREEMTDFMNTIAEQTRNDWQ